ncbi:MAG: DUF2442 domain-containing protein [Actinobacteria bacterium]|nr:DUF2442 domain-containing protein [Actinomycetota bacterium]
MSAPYEIRAVEHLDGHRLRLTFADGLVGDIDLADRFTGPVGPVFEPLREVDYFAQVSVDEELGTWSRVRFPHPAREHGRWLPQH